MVGRLGGPAKAEKEGARSEGAGPNQTPLRRVTTTASSRRADSAVRERSTAPSRSAIIGAAHRPSARICTGSRIKTSREDGNHIRLPFPLLTSTVLAGHRRATRSRARTRGDGADSAGSIRTPLSPGAPRAQHPFGHEHRRGARPESQGPAGRLTSPVGGPPGPLRTRTRPRSRSSARCHRSNRRGRRRTASPRPATDNR